MFVAGVEYEAKERLSVFALFGPDIGEAEAEVAGVENPDDAAAENIGIGVVPT